MWTVPAPPALDPGAEEPKEIAAARKTADKLAAEQAEQAEQAAAQAEQAARAAGQPEPPGTPPSGPQEGQS
jgi:NADH-quinone oxidoreductase subunit I